MPKAANIPAIDNDPAQEQIVPILAELGNSSRYNIYRLLLRRGRTGANITEIAEVLDIPLTTLSFHLNRLKAVGLVHSVKNGRESQCYAELGLLQRVLRQLDAECCQEMPNDNPHQ